MLTFGQFCKTGVSLDIEDAAKDLNCDIEELGDAAAIWIYESDCYLSELESGEFHLIIERSEYISESRDDLEKILYLDWYVSECVTDHTIADFEYIRNMIRLEFRQGITGINRARDLIRVDDWAYTGIQKIKGGF